MQIYKNQGIGSASIAYDRIQPVEGKGGGFRAYSAENWAKVSFFRRVLALIFSQVTEVPIGNAKYYVVKKSLSRFANEKITTNKRLIQLLSKVLASKIQKPQVPSYSPPTPPTPQMVEPKKPQVEPQPTPPPQEDTSLAIVPYTPTTPASQILADYTVQVLKGLFSTTRALAYMSADLVRKIYTMAQAERPPLAIEPAPIELPQTEEEDRGPMIEELFDIPAVSFDEESEEIEEEPAAVPDMSFDEAEALVIDVATGSAEKRAFMQELAQILQKNVRKEKKSQSLSFGTRLNPLYLRLTFAEQMAVKSFFEQHKTQLKSHFTRDGITAIYTSETMQSGAGFKRK